MFRSGLVALAALVLVACNEQPRVAPAGVPATATATIAAEARTRFATVRALLAHDPESKVRAYQLYAAVDPICARTDERAAFAAEVGAIAKNDQGAAAERAIEAIDVLEHVATACARNSTSAAHDLLAQAIIQLPRLPRLQEIDARIAAAGSDLAGALSAAKAARALGSIHAIPLIATIQAQIARNGAPGYRSGMLDEAIATVSVEPDGAWLLIDLTALLSTRARLLSERALWESGAVRKKTLDVARPVYERLSGQPFIEKTRTHALDMRCFDAVELGEGPEVCLRAAEEAGILGAAFVTSTERAKDKIDRTRLEDIKKIHQRLEAMPAGGLALLVARGDESELIAWARPAADVLLRLRDKHAKLVVIDRTSGLRAGALLDRIVELAELKPLERIDAENDIFAVGCFAALVAKRKAPASCPFPTALQKKLTAAGELAAAFLVGRDLDAEIEDLRLYELPTVLLSVRQPATDRKFDAHLKSVSDALLLSPRGKKLW